MADRNQLSVLPAPPRYQPGNDQDFQNQVNRWRDNLYRWITGVNYGRFNGLYLPNLPTTGYGLSPGEVFSNGGVLTLVRPGDIWAGSLSSSAEVGTVKVTT